MLIKVYGDTIHRNDGRHLHCGMENNTTVCMLYDRRVSYLHLMYSPPQGQVGREYLETLADL